MSFDRQSDGSCCYFLFGSSSYLSWCHASSKNLVGNIVTFSGFHSNDYRLPPMAIYKAMGISREGVKLDE